VPISAFQHDAGIEPIDRRSVFFSGRRAVVQDATKLAYGGEEKVRHNQQTHACHTHTHTHTAVRGRRIDTQLIRVRLNALLQQTLSIGVFSSILLLCNMSTYAFVQSLSTAKSKQKETCFWEAKRRGRGETERGTVTLPVPMDFSSMCYLLYHESM
jgi:hypothetical protein